MNQVPPLKELNVLCQKPRYREVGNWMVRHILRDAALPITWLLLHTGVTANQVTASSLLIGLLGVGLFALTAKGFFLAGALGLQLWYLLDHVDGQIARYRGTSCLTGRFFDFLTHHVIHGVIFFSLGYHCFKVTGHLFFILWGFLASVSMMLFNLMQDTKYKTFFEKLSTLKSVDILPADEAEKPPPAMGNRGLLKTGFSWMHKSSEIHVLMNILTLAAILGAATGLAWDLRLLAFVVYGFMVPVMTLIKIHYWIVNRKIDEEFESVFKSVRL